MAIHFECPWPNAPDWLAALRDLLPAEDIRVWPEVGEASEIDLAIIMAGPPEALAGYPNLQAVLCLGAGVDQFMADPAFPKQVPVARLIDPLLASRMAEYVAGHVLRHHLRFDLYREQQARAHWQRHPARDAGSIGVGILGLGQLGAAAAAKLAGLGFRVYGWSRGPKRIDTITCHTDLAAMLPKCDALVCLLPLTDATRGILNADLFAALPVGAHVINCARGAHVVQADLIAALDRGHLAAVTLDVFEIEPLAADHPFWRHPKITVTPHVSSLSDIASGTAILAEQIARLRRGERLKDLVDASKGY